MCTNARKKHVCCSDYSNNLQIVPIFMFELSLGATVRFAHWVAVFYSSRI